MKISKISISGYRSIGDKIELNLNSVNALVGGNNVGKSNILNAIWSVLGKDWVTVNNFDENDVYLRDPEKNIEIEVEFSEPYLYSQYKGIDPIEIPKLSFCYTKYKKGEFSGQRRLEKKCLKIDNEPVYIFTKKPQKGEQSKFQPLTSIPQDIQENLPVIFIGSNRNLKYQLPGSKNSILEILLKDIDADFKNPENTITVTNKDGEKIEVSRLERFNQCIKYAIESLRTEDFNKLESAIRNNALTQLGFDPTNEDLNIYFNPLTSKDFYNSLQIYVNEGGFEINATELGSGFQNALVIAILRAFEERKKSGALFLIEEPEMFLHPQMQRTLYKTIREIGKTNQIIYTTHSPHFVTIPEFDEVLLISKKQTGTTKKQSSLKKSAVLEEKLRKEFDPERNELFFAKRVLLVEGDTEKLALPEYAKKEGLNFDSFGGTIVEVGGKRNLDIFAKILSSFEIPFGILYDTDSDEFEDKRDEEKIFNSQIEKYKESGAEIWGLNKNYEDVLKNSVGEQNYQKLCQKFPKTSKAVKARLIANEADHLTPELLKPAIYWLADKRPEKIVLETEDRITV